MGKKKRAVYLPSTPASRCQLQGPHNCQKFPVGQHLPSHSKKIKDGVLGKMTVIDSPFGKSHMYSRCDSDWEGTQYGPASIDMNARWVVQITPYSGPGHTHSSIQTLYLVE